MALAKDAVTWLKPYLSSTPPNTTIFRQVSLGYVPTPPLVIKSGVFTLAFGGIESPPTARTERKPNSGSPLVTSMLTVARPMGFYGVRLEASGFQNWYSKDSLKTPIERFYWGIVSFDCDNACVKQTSLKQSRQIILVPEVQQLVSGVLAVPEDVDLRVQAKHLLPARLSGYIHWEDMAAEVSFFGITETWTAQWNG